MSDQLDKYLERTGAYPESIRLLPPGDLSMLVVIPALAETELTMALQSLANAHPPGGCVEVIAVINHAETASREVVVVNEMCRTEALAWAREHSRADFFVHVLYVPDLPAKRSGVGLARKIGMDEAVRRAYRVGRPETPVVSFDADCLCDPNYMVEIHEYFKGNPSKEGCSIRFQHRTEGLSAEHEDAIRSYEQHLTCYIGGLRYAGHPFAFQTIGSAMAVRAGTYVAVGGMNTRQAGEDFYFLQKVIERGNFGELLTTTVHPSSRVSHRVPFGTGKAVSDTLSGQRQMTYNPQSYEDLRILIISLDDLLKAEKQDEVLRRIPDSIRTYLESQDVKDKLSEIREHTASARTRRKRFIMWFNAFRTMKYLHWARDRFYPDVEPAMAAEWLSKGATGKARSGAT